MGLSGPVVVVLGGGPDIDVVLRGLKRHSAQLTALISPFDAGGRAPGDADEGEPAGGARARLLALGADPAATQILERLFAYRVGGSDGPAGPTFGSLLLGVLADITGGTDRALEAAAQMLNVHGRVLPLTLHSPRLVAELAGGRETSVRTPADLIAAARESGLRGVRVDPPAPALDAALHALASADIIVLGPTDFWFDVVAPLGVGGVREAITQADAVKIFLCGARAQPYTTAGWPASRYIRVVLDALQAPASLDYAVFNSTPLPTTGEAPVAAAETRIPLDLDACLALHLDIIARPLCSGNGGQYDPEKLARTILVLGGQRARSRVAAPGGRALHGHGRLDGVSVAERVGPQRGKP